MKTRYCANKKNLKRINKTVDFLNVIAEENRLKIFCLLKSGERCVCDIWQYLGITQNLASHHLKILKEAGLINSRKEGLKVIYWLNKKEINKLNSLLTNFLQSYGEK
jgi:ArsR family transcriptional regulator